MKQDLKIQGLSKLGHYLQQFYKNQKLIILMMRKN